VLAGAHGYALKEIDSAALLRAVHAVAERHSILDPSVTEQALKWLRDISKGSAHPEAEPLSPQEERVLALVAEGQTNKEIATALSLSDKTVTNYLANVFQKPRVTRPGQAAAFFAKRKQ
jgi:DNA-binding NarL/FixJ family response regulator